MNYLALPEESLHHGFRGRSWEKMLTNAPHYDTLHRVPLLDAHHRGAQVQQVFI